MERHDAVPGDDRLALIADVGRSALRIGITDRAGHLRSDTVRTFSPTEEPTVSGAIGAVAREQGLLGLPTRLAVAVSGVPRGDTISVTNGRWRVSRSGLSAMMQSEPLMLNDFAANAWAISDRTDAFLEPIVGAAITPRLPGTYCIIGVGSGLGVALLSRDAHGSVTVLPTEAGHCAFPTGLPALDPVCRIIGARHGFTSAEMMISAPGLLACYRALADIRRARATITDPREVIRLATSRGDEIAADALALFVRALWHFAANMVLAYGAFDGVILTGSVAAALRRTLGQADLAPAFLLPGPYQRHLGAVPRSLSALANAELSGAAIALAIDHDRRRAA